MANRANRLWKPPAATRIALRRGSRFTPMSALRAAERDRRDSGAASAIRGNSGALII